MSRPVDRRVWRVGLWYRGRLVDERRVNPGGELSIGEGGDIVVPGIAGRKRWLAGPEISPIEGLTAAASEAGQRFVVGSHPDVELTLDREVRGPTPYREGLIRAPTRELAYGFCVAICIASLLAVDVAVSPHRPAEEKDKAEPEDSALVLAMYEVAPLPSSTLLEIDPVVAALPEPLAAAPDLGLAEPDAEEEDEDELPQADDELVQETEEPAPKPKEIRNRRRRKKQRAEVEDAVLMGGILTAKGESSDWAILGTLSALDSAGGGESIANVLDDVDELEAFGGLIGGVIEEAPPPEALEAPVEATAGVAIARIGGLGVRTKEPSVNPTKAVIVEEEGIVGGAAAVAPDVECEVTFKPKPQVDVVFVVDVSDGMVMPIATLSHQLAALDAEVRKHDARPHYGLVTFVDEVVMMRGGKPTSSVVTLTGDLEPHLGRAAQNRQPENDALNDEDTENGLDALHAAATDFDWRDASDTLHLIVYLSDAPAGRRGAVLSGTKVDHGFGEVADAIDDIDARVASFTEKSARGFVRGWGDAASLPAKTGGTAFSLDRFESGRLSLRSALTDLLRNPVCERSLLDVLE